jgi:hypothetical protein
VRGKPATADWLKLAKSVDEHQKKKKLKSS